MECGKAMGILIPFRVRIFKRGTQEIYFELLLTMFFLLNDQLRLPVVAFHSSQT